MKNLVLYTMTFTKSFGVSLEDREFSLFSLMCMAAICRAGKINSLSNSHEHSPSETALAIELEQVLLVLA